MSGTQAGAGVESPSGILRQDVDGLVALACRAPSVANTQPWRFHYADGVVEVRVDPGRRLQTADPAGRELLISCGAAVSNLELGIRGLGLEPRVRLLPAVSDPLLLATVRGLPGRALAESELRLLSAVHRRHTHRGPFAAAAPAPALLDELAQTTRSHGARLVVLPGGPAADAVIELAWRAAARQHDGTGWTDEALAWAAEPGSSRRDGMLFVPPPGRGAQPRCAARSRSGRRTQLGHR